MKGYDLWYKFQACAAIHLIRWSSKQKEDVWNKLLKCLNQLKDEIKSDSKEYLSLAIMAMEKQYKPFINLANVVGKKQLLALIVLMTEPDATNPDLISKASDVMDEILHIERQEQEQYSTAITNKAQRLLPLAKKGEDFKSGRRKGAIKKTTQYLINLSSRNPHKGVKELYKIALLEASKGLSPYDYDHACDEILLDDDVEVDLKKFTDRHSKAINRHMR